MESRRLSDSIPLFLLDVLLDGSHNVSMSIKEGLKSKKLKPSHTIEEVTDMLIESMRDHDTGWAYAQEPTFKFENSIDPAIKSFVEFVIPSYNQVQKKFKITIEEA